MSFRLRGQIVAGAVGGALLLSGCNPWGEDPLERLLVDRPPAGFELQDEPSGPMDFEEAAGSTTVPSSAMRRQLRRTSFQAGYARVWTKEHDFLTILVFDFPSARGARQLVDFQKRELGELVSTVPFTVRRIQGAAGFTLSARRRDQTPLFCQIVWFAQGARAFEVRTCGRMPVSTHQVVDLARRQARVAKG